MSKGDGRLGICQVRNTDWSRYTIKKEIFGKLIGTSALRSYIYNGSQDNEASEFTPIKGLSQRDGDVAIFFLSANGILYTRPVDDPWYSAHRIGLNNTGYFTGAKPVTFYYADEAASALECREQYQICDPVLPSEQGCSSWGGLLDIGYTTLPRTPPDSGKEKMISWATAALGGIVEAAFSIGVSSLVSRYRLSADVQVPLPTNQWQTEVENWNNIRLARLQAMAVNTATGPGDTAMLKNSWQRPSNKEENYLCQNQVSQDIYFVRKLPGTSIRDTKIRREYDENTPDLSLFH